MEILQKLLQPAVFFGLLGVIFLVSIFVIRSMSSFSKNNEEEKEAETRRDRKRIGELEAMVVDRDEEHKRKLSQVEESEKSKEEELRNMIVSLQEKLKSAEQAGAKSSNDELEKAIKRLQDEQARLKSDLTLKTQMYDGLKGQYDELEKEVVRLNKQLDEERKRLPAQNKPQSQAIPESSSEP